VTKTPGSAGSRSASTSITRRRIKGGVMVTKLRGLWARWRESSRQDAIDRALYRAAGGRGAARYGGAPECPRAQDRIRGALSTSPVPAAAAGTAAGAFRPLGDVGDGSGRAAIGTVERSPRV
jgi:hypothetical protein